MADWKGRLSPTVTEVGYGVAPRSHLDGAVAWIVRDPQAEPKQLVVMSREDVNDRVYVIAKNLMQRDIAAFPNVTGRRVVVLYRDERVRIEEGGTVRWSNIRMDVVNLSTTIGPEILRRHDTAPEIDVPGIGKVRLVFPQIKE